MDAMLPKVSIIVPVYKAEKTLARCVETIMAQTHPAIEIILVDDGSPDRCGEICDELAAQDTRIRVIHQPNGGVSSARNAGIAAATGEFVCFVDSDDEVYPDYVATMYERMANTDVDLVVCNYETHEINRTYNQNIEDCELIVSAVPFADGCKLIDSPYMWGPWNKMFRRQVLVDHGLLFDTEVPFGEDTIFVYQYMCHCHGLALVSHPVYVYKTENSVATNKYYPRMWYFRKKMFESEKELFGCFLSTDDEKRQGLASRAATHLRVSVRHSMLHSADKKATLQMFADAYAYFFAYVQPFVDRKEIFDPKTGEWVWQHRDALKNGDLSTLYTDWHRMEREKQKKKKPNKKKIKKMLIGLKRRLLRKE